MTAFSPWRNKHGVLTHHASLRSHFFTLCSDISALLNTQISALLRFVLTGVGVIMVDAVQDVNVAVLEMKLCYLCFDSSSLN